MNYPFYINDFDRVKDHKIKYPLVSKIFEHPVSFWYGSRNGKGCTDLDKGIGRLLKRTLPNLPVFVIYNLPNRDMGHYSKGGSANKLEYLDFMDQFCKGIGSHPVIVIFEPDALPHATLMDKEDAEFRLDLMREGLSMLTQRTNASVYVDIGHSNWLGPEEAGKMLNQVVNSSVRGFSVNVSNFRTTTESMAWAKRVSEYSNVKQFVIDTSRNGQGPYGNEWCNPPGRSLGSPPTTNTGEDLCDAFLWIKIPGESDGTGNGGPRAGRFWPEYANELVDNTDWV